MSLVSSSISNLVNGVSQQPYTLRLSSQAEIQENGLSTVSEGLKKRPPTRHVKKILSSPLSNAFIHTINRDPTEQYEVVITNGDLRVFDLAGNEKTVSFPNGKAYLTATDPKSQFRALTVADYTFILNSSVTVLESTSTVPARNPEALVIVKSGQYAKTYSVILNGSTVATYTTPDGSVSSHAAQISTDYIAGQLVGGISSAGYTATQTGATIYVTRATDFTISTVDGFNNAAMIAVKGQIQRFSDLPAVIGANGFTLEVVGDKSSSFDDYWVKYDTTNGTGVWKETVKPGIKLGFQDATMPFGLIRNADGTFTFKVLDWADRVVGDDKSAPQPSFVGRKIADLFFHRNRLGMIADESVVMSGASDFFNFHPTTVTALLDGDRIDVSVSHVKVANLVAAVPFSRQLILFSQQTQFAMEGGDILTPKTVSVKPTTEFECLNNVRPVGVGRNIYFATPKGDYVGMREYSVDINTNTEDAVEVTSHVPTYIPSGVFKIASASNEDLLAVLTSGDQSAIYIYKFYWNNDQKLQSSWSRWVFPSTDQVLNVDFIESQMILVINRPDGVYLETLNVSTDTELAGEPYLVHLDRKKTIPKASLTFDGTNTVITPAALGWSPTDGSYVAVTPSGQPKRAGIISKITWNGTNATIPGDFTTCDLIVGRQFAFRYRFSTIVPKTKTASGGEKADTVGRLQLRSMQVNYADTGYFRAEVTPYGRQTYTNVFSGKVLGLPSSTIGQINLETGSFRFPIRSRNTGVTIDLVSDSPLPASFLSADWEGFYAKRSADI